jgi:arylsulfatase A
MSPFEKLLNMHRPTLLMLIACCAWLAVETLSPTVAHAKTPNIVLIMIDDLGWMDLACQGNRLVETPNLDRLAEQGMRFTNACAAAPVCSPTRAAIITGKSPARLQITNHIPDQPRFAPDDAKLLSASMRDHLPLDEVTLSERLLEAGYATGFFGKWHLAGRGDPALYPDRQGFQVNVGGCALGGPPSFFDPYRIPTLPDRRPGEYLPDRLVDEAIEFITASKERPFFVCLWTYTVHWPMEAPEALLKKYADRKGPGLNDTRYGAMIEAMDGAIGKLLAELDRLELTNDTLVVFTSDNGGFGGVADNRPLRAEKGHLYEGGLRVPMIVRWPKVVRAGSECDVPVVSMDMYPTLLDAAGVSRKDNEAPDGENLLPLFNETGSLKRDAIYFHYPNYAFHGSNRLGGAVRSGRYKRKSPTSRRNCRNV